MNPKKIKQLAEEFELVANKYASFPNVASLLNMLKDLLSKAKSGSIIKTVEQVPGEHYFQEGDLSDYQDLEVAYSKFKMALITEDKQYSDLKLWAEKRKQEMQKTSKKNH